MLPGSGFKKNNGGVGDSKFPRKGMKALLAEFPEEERVVQVRIAKRSGSYVTVEGPISEIETRAILHALSRDHVPHLITEAIEERLTVGPAEDDSRVSGYRIRGPWRETREQAARDGAVLTFFGEDVS